MAILNPNGLEAAVTTFESLTETTLDTGREDGPWAQFTRVFDAGGSDSLNITMAGALPVAEQWTASKTFQSFRIYEMQVALRKYQASLELDRMQVEYDKTGLVGSQIQKFVSKFAYFYDDLVIDELLGNPTCIDGSDLLSDSHSFGPTTTWDNLGSGALSYANFEAGMVALRTLRDEKGEYMGIRPDTLLVGPAQLREALEITGADTRPVSVSTASEIGGVVGAIPMINVYRGQVTVLESARFSNGTNTNDWLLFDSRWPLMGLMKGVGPRAVVQDRLEDEARFLHDKYRFSLEADARAFGFMPWGVYGVLT